MYFMTRTLFTFVYLIIVSTPNTSATTLMPPSLRAVTVLPRHALGRRHASHGAPHYNEPTGWLFGEKVSPPHLAVA